MPVQGDPNEARRAALSASRWPVDWPDHARGAREDQRGPAPSLGSLARRSISRRIPSTVMTAAPVGHNGGPPIAPPTRKRGRPSSYTPELADIICDRLAAPESLKSICRDPGMPSERAVLSWAANRPEFRRQYDLARDFGRQMACEEVLEIADRVHNTPEAIKEARRLIDAKKWHLGRMAPKRRGPLPVTVGP